jgi:hypothetical protein
MVLVICRVVFVRCFLLPRGLGFHSKVWNPRTMATLQKPNSMSLTSKDLRTETGSSQGQDPALTGSLVPSSQPPAQSYLVQKWNHIQTFLAMKSISQHALY